MSLNTNKKIVYEIAKYLDIPMHTLIQNDGIISESDTYWRKFPSFTYWQIFDNVSQNKTYSVRLKEGDILHVFDSRIFALIKNVKDILIISDIFSEGFVKFEEIKKEYERRTKNES